MKDEELKAGVRKKMMKKVSKERRSGRCEKEDEELEEEGRKVGQRKMKRRGRSTRVPPLGVPSCTCRSGQVGQHVGIITLILSNTTVSPISFLRVVRFSH